MVDALSPDLSASPAATRSRSGAAVGWYAAADVLAVLLFVVIGRRAHGEALTPVGIAATGWPFLVGVAGGWLGLKLFRLPAVSARGALMVCLKTVVIGLALRWGVAHDGVPLPFVLVTIVTLAVFFGGWRAVAGYRDRVTAA